MNKTTRLFLTVGLWLIPAWTLAASPLPMGSAGEVTLNWQKFNDIWDKMQALQKKVDDLEKPEHLPPVPFTITKAAYKGNVLDSKIAMTAIFELDVYEAKEWVKIPFLPSSVAITEARLDGEPVGVMQDGGFHQLVIKKPGRHVLQIRFALKAPKAEEAPEFRMAIQETPMTLIALEFPRPKLDVTIEPAQGVETSAVGSNHTLVTAALSPTSYINVHWQKAAAEEAAGPAKLYVESQQLITVSEGTLKSHWGFHYSILHKGVREIRLRVPEAWNILAANADGMQEWKMVTGSHGPELAIQLAYARRGSLDISVEGEKGLGEKDDVLELPRLIPLDVEREQGTLGVEAKGAIELQVKNTDGLHAIDPKELPGGLWQTATQPILFAFRYTKPYSLAMAITRHPEVAVLSTTIDDANGITVLTPRGQMITKVRYQVRNQLKQYLAVRLPKGAELWSAFVAGEPVKPTQAQDGSYRIPLAKSQLGDAGQQGFPVELIYYRSVSRFTPVGYRALSLPMPDAPVSRMIWSLYLPEKYRFPYFGGDVEKGEMAQPWNALRGLAGVDRLDVVSHNEPASTSALREERSSLKKGVAQLAGAMFGGNARAAVLQSVAKQSELADELFQEKDKAPTAVGIFPVAFELPATGQLFHFGQVMIVGQDPTVTLWYVHANIIRTLVVLMLGILGFVLVRMRALILKGFESIVSRIRSLMPERLSASRSI